jgi:2-keto-4-pentenoate hydratase/2-oxohepta-3-ene-1,7-dioic acid hydratase in catechol pathway
MQLISYSRNNSASYGILNGESITDLGEKLGNKYPNLQSLLAAGLAVLDGVEQTEDCSLSEVTLLPVIPNPGSIWCAGMNTHSHFEEAKAAMKLEEVPKTPMFFLRAAGTLVASGQALEKPAKEPAFDYEGEVAIIIGKPCRSVSEAEALDYVAGYSCFNDGSARLYQINSGQMTTGKNAWHSGGFGPSMTTADSVDLDSMELVSRVNGETRQTMKLDDLIFSFAYLISHISEVYELQPGDVIVTGSAAGVGAFWEPPTFLQAGDTVEVEVSGLGTLVNTIQDQAL